MRYRSTKEGVSHWVDGRNTWMIGLNGYFLRSRGFFTALLPAVITAGVPFWWPANFQSSFIIDIKTMFFTVLLIIVIIIIIAYKYVKYRTIRSLNIKSDLHFQIHASRDKLCSMFAEISPNINKLRMSSENIKGVRDFANQICQTMANYYSNLYGDNSIGCAIRLRVTNSSLTDILYVTIGRGGTLASTRENTSEPIKCNKGVPAFFLTEDIGKKGVLLFDNIEKAVINGSLERDKNMKHFPDDVKTMAVAPINGWNGQEMDLIGLLYVTSKTDRILNPHHIDLIKFSADCLSTTFSTLFASFLPIGFLQQPNQGR